VIFKARSGIRSRKNFLNGLILLACAIMLTGCVSQSAAPASSSGESLDANAVGTTFGQLIETPTPVPTRAAEGIKIPTQAPTGIIDPSDTSGEQGNADVIFVRAKYLEDGIWTFYVTVQHLDIGWNDYADGWDVLTPEGEVLKPDPQSQFTRTLLHPHVDEQPFTRSQSGIAIPAGVDQVRVRAHDLVHGFGGREVVVDLTAVAGPNFEIER